MEFREQLHRPRGALAVALLAFAGGLFATSAGAQQCTVKPAVISLGQTIRLRCEVPAATARLKDGPNGRTVRLFKQGSGGWEGLMPVAVEDSPGAYPIEFLAADRSAPHYSRRKANAHHVPRCRFRREVLGRSARRAASRMRHLALWCEA